MSWSWLSAAIIVLIALTVGIRLVENRFAFFPSGGEDVTPASLGASFQAGFITSSDGQRLRVWSFPRADAKAEILYFHGNGGNLSVWSPILRGIWDRGYAVHALDYRGYGLSTGVPTEQGLYRDVDAFLEWSGRQSRSSGRLIYWGRSLGGVMAAYAASIRPPDAVIIESGFPDVRSLLRRSPLLPFSLLSSLRFPTKDFLAAVTVPVLVLHGDADSVIPFSAGRELFQRVVGPKRFVTIRGGDHNDAEPSDPSTYWSAIDAVAAYGR